MQRTTIIGRVGKDAEVKELKSGKVINFSVAVTEKWIKNGETQEKTTWYECAKFGDSVKVAEYIQKGSLIYVEGSCIADAYLSGGETKAVLRLNVQRIELLSSKGVETTKDERADYPKTESKEDDDLPF